MYTRCPKCETCFRVTDRHLAIAKGKVRCGKCQLVFNALDNAIDDLPGNSATTQAPVTPAPRAEVRQPLKTEVKAAAEKPSARAAEVNDVAKTATAKHTQTEVTAKTTEVKKEKESPVPPPKVAPPLFKADADINERKKDEVKNINLDSSEDHHDAFHMDDDSFDENFDFDAAIDELAHAAEEVTYDYGSTAIIEEPINLKAETAKAKKEKPEDVKNDDVFSTDAYDKTNASSVADILNEMEGQLSLNIDTPAQPENKNYDADDEFQFIELDRESAEDDKEEQAEESNDEFIKNNFNLDEFDLDDELDDLDSEEPVVEKTSQHHKNSVEDSAEEFLDQFEALDTPGNKLKEEIIIAEPSAEKDPSIKIGEHSDGYEVPYQLREDVDRLNAPIGRSLHPAFKLLLIVLLLVLSFSQVAYFRAHELVNIIPESRSMLETFCENIGCQYSGPSDNKQIELVSRDVRLHPKEKNALLISAVMVNNAYFSQPYPNIHIRLSDISGNVVAERVFNPKTYMGKLSNPFLLMRSKTPVHINFEVVDPGKDAVNFEFTFL